MFDVCSASLTEYRQTNTALYDTSVDVRPYKWLAERSSEQQHHEQAKLQMTDGISDRASRLRVPAKLTCCMLSQRRHATPSWSAYLRAHVSLSTMYCNSVLLALTLGSWRVQVVRDVHEDADVGMRWAYDTAQPAGGHPEPYSCIHSRARWKSSDGKWTSSCRADSPLMPSTANQRLNRGPECGHGRRRRNALPWSAIRWCLPSIILPSARTRCGPPTDVHACHRLATRRIPVLLSCIANTPTCSHVPGGKHD